MVTLLVPSGATPPAKKGGTKAGQYPDGPTRHVTAEGPGQNRPLCAEPDDPPPSEAAIPKGCWTRPAAFTIGSIAQGKSTSLSRARRHAMAAFVCTYV